MDQPRYVSVGMMNLVCTLNLVTEAEIMAESTNYGETLCLGRMEKSGWKTFKAFVRLNM
ncbi:hypothetical protein CM15mP5_1310 [bacterium]|nr:MAG: hypothetical protein CM15mP5_1310 [bacterium]